MTSRSDGGGITARWAYGVLLTLCAALAVLVHHEISTTEVPSMRGAAHALHVTAAQAQQAVPEPSVHGADVGGCAMPSMQHCTTASVDSVQLAAPGQSEFVPLTHLRQSAVGCAPAAAVGRAPPDLSVLSQLRI
ncbi:hypothetical protein [Streptomyces sp. NL15-2K]|uniref:hypothetical protein n=1 Tax=Streptomyces sp. NL15-2K TaxID=376149 RepID=UPI00155AE9C2|nr:MULTISPECIES: hypothetical protein [Actinomycetes]WKX06827.1 hypothetical protein Q4V64_04670 [Kutzneria buriramensis]